MHLAASSTPTRPHPSAEHAGKFALLSKLMAVVAWASFVTTGCGGDPSTGAAGPPGPAGAAGTNGSNGSVGAAGATGPAGLDGANGSNGSNGSAGSAGSTGLTGSTGPAGPAGPPGAPATAQPGAGALTINNAALSSMPQANSVTVEVALDGGTQVLRMFTPATPANPVGTFVGGGTGNKAIVGLTGFNGMKLTDLGGLEFDAKVLQGPVNNFYMNFLIDLDCTADETLSALTIADLRLRRRVLIWNPDIASGYAVGGGYTRYAGSFASSQWNLVGTPFLGIPANGSPSGPIVPLAGYPFACIVDGVSADGGLPRNTSDPTCVTAAALPTTASANCGAPTAGALLLLGDSVNVTQKEIFVKRVRVRDRVISFN